MKSAILLLLLLAAVTASRLLSKLYEMNDDDCWEQRNVSIAVDDLPSLYKHFVACLEKCRGELKSRQRITITSRLKSSVAVLRELYYRGGISFSVSMTTEYYSSLSVRLCVFFFF